ncbi:MAG: hypothetical protein RLZZ22_1117 [Pseudomonadota bacterium]
MSMTPEQIAAANKAQLESLVALTKQAFKGIEQLVALNMQVAKQSIDETAEKAKDAMGMKDVKDFADVQAKLIQPASDKAMAYGRQVADIAASTQAEVTRLAQEQLKQAQAQMQALAEAASKNMPAGAEGLSDMAKNAMTQASQAFESVQQAARQATTSAEENLKSLVATAERAAKAAAAEVKKGGNKST